MNKLRVSPVLIAHWSLYGLLLLLVAGVAGGTYTLHQMLSNAVTEANRLKIDSEVNEQAIANAERLERVLAENSDNVTRAAAIVADTKYYTYQDQIVQDISTYAAAANLTVLGFDFTSSKTGAASVKGLKTVNATISLQSPVAYTDYLRFIKLIERNLTKMQITQLDISNDLKVPGAISSPIINVEVYVR